MALTLVPDPDRPSPEERRFVCTWCGGAYAKRSLLAMHRTDSAPCRVNASAVSGMRPDAQVFGQRPPQPGEATLRAVRANTTEEDRK